MSQDIKNKLRFIGKTVQELLERVRRREKGDENVADRFSACESSLSSLVSVALLSS